jgi:2-oxoisovalerate dehydrogenase E1 component
LIEMRGAAVELSEARLLALYEWMLTGRILESSLLEAEAVDRGGFRYSGLGQEAAQVGFSSALDPGDVLAPGHRDLLASLVRGVSLEEALLDIFGRAAGPSRGRRATGAPVPARGILGVGGDTAEAVAVAVGAALAFWCRGEARVALALCGEGTAASGAWHEAVNAAAVLGLPVVFGVENNQYAHSQPNEGVSRLAYTAHRADGYGIPGIVVDGNDVLEVHSAAREAVERARAGEGPSLVEAVTFRQAGHHPGDPAGYVDAETRRSWLARDPLPRYEEFLGSRGLLDGLRRGHLEERVRSRVAQTLEWARQQPESEAAALDAPAALPGDEVPLPAAVGPAVALGEALARALGEEMERDPAVVLLGPDSGAVGGPHGITRGLRERYGPRRVVDFPSSGPGLVGAAVGAARFGLRPVAEVPARHLPSVLGLLAAHAAGPEDPAALVLRVPCGPGPGAEWDLVAAGAVGRGAGLTVVAPATAAAAKGLLAAAIRAPGPVAFLEPVSLYAGAATPLPPGDYTIPPGRARVARAGDGVTVVAWGAGVGPALEAAEEAAAQGIGVEVIDLQTLAPIDAAAVLASIERTGRLVVVDDAPGGGVGADLVALVAQAGFWHLDAPVQRVVPPGLVPFALEDVAGPRPAAILAAVLSSAHT